MFVSVYEVARLGQEVLEEFDCALRRRPIREMHLYVRLSNAGIRTKSEGKNRFLAPCHLSLQMG